MADSVARPDGPPEGVAVGDARVIQGDSLEVLPTLGRIDAVVTDPPYGMGWRTNSKRFSGGNRALRPGEGRDDWAEIAGDDQPFDPSPWLAYPKVVLWGYHHFAQRLPAGTVLVWVKKADHLFGTFLSDAETGWMKGGHGVYCFRKQFPRRRGSSRPAGGAPTRRRSRLS